MIAIDNLNGGGTVDLSGIYKQLNNLNSSVQNLENLTSLSSLSSDIWNLSTNLDAAWENITGIKEGISYAILPMILDNSSAIDSLSTSVLRINSSLAALQQSCSDITNSLSTLTGGGGLLTNSTFNYQAFNTTLKLASVMNFTGDFILSSGSIYCGYKNWNLSILNPMYYNSKITASGINILHMTNMYIDSASFNANQHCLLNGCSFNFVSISVKRANFENCYMSKCNLTATCAKFELCDYLYSNTVINCRNLVMNCNMQIGFSYSGCKSLSFENNTQCSKNTFKLCSCIEFNNCESLNSLSFYNIPSYVSFKNVDFKFSNIGVEPMAYFDGNSSYACTLFLENCKCNNYTASNDLIQLFRPEHSGVSLVFSFR